MNSKETRLTLDTAQQMQKVVEEAMGDKYATNVADYSINGETFYVVGLWTRGTYYPLGEIVCSFNSYEKWKLFQNAAKMFARNEQTREYEAWIEQVGIVGDHRDSDMYLFAENGPSLA